MTWRVRDVLAIAALLGAVATVIVAFDTNVNLGFEAPELRTALETSQALIAVACAYLVFGRVKRARSMNDLAVVFALALLGASNVFFAALPSRGLEGRLIFQTWAPMTLRLVAASAIAWASLARERQIPPRIQRPGLTAVMATDVVLATVAIGVAVLRSALPRGVTVGMSHPGNPPDLHGHDVLIGGFLMMSVLLGAASYGFLKRSERRRDSLIGALAIACALQTFSYLCFAVYPSINTEIIQLGDFLRLGFYFVLLFGGEREIDRYWTRLADIAIFEERRRLARDLHDGVAQELAFVVTQTRLLQRGTAPPDANQSIAAAAERALDESRRAITALSMRDDEPLHLAIARAAEDVAGRVDVDIVCEIPPRSVSPALREGLVRIVQEAVSNAGRHGHAQRVTITLDSDDVLRIVDDGSGFDTSETAEGRYGLVSMRERSEQIGGRFRIESAPGKGTTVEIELP